jgi:hypothetical protein
MPKTLELSVRQQRIMREALEAKIKLVSRSLGGKRDRWAQEQLQELADMMAQLCKPVMVERVNLMSGEKYMEAEDTPNYCSPASEAYWSM